MSEQTEIIDEQAARVVRASYLMETSGIWEEVAHERGRAHLKHGKTSMEELDGLDLIRLTVLMEEVGEVAREFNEARHTGVMRGGALRKELIQVAAMAGAWADTLGRCSHCGQEFDTPPCLTMASTGKQFHSVYGGDHYWHGVQEDDRPVELVRFTGTPAGGEQEETRP